MEIIYILVSLILFISVVLIKKSDKDQNLLFWLVLTAVITLCYNVFLSYILTMIRLKSTLIIMAGVNLVLAIILIVKMYKDKNIQKYYIRVKDIIAFVILFVLVCGIGYIQYGLSFEIKYETTDPAVHYNFAENYYEEQTTPAGEQKTTMPGAYTNTGILFTIFSNWLEDIELYKVFILFDLTILYLIGAMFYIGITNKIESISKSIVAFIISIMFLCSYPLNSLIFGYSYLSVAILLMTAIISISTYIKTKELYNTFYLIYMFLLTYGIFFTYYLFVPVIYASLGLYMLFDMIKNRKDKNIFSILTKENIVNVMVILIIPTILGFCYFILPGLIQNDVDAVNYIAMEGYCYRNLFSYFLVFAPLVLYYCIEKIKNKENSFVTIEIILVSIFTLILLYMGLKGEASSYYYYKIYFLISILIMNIATKAIYRLMDNKQQIYGYSFIIVYITILIASILGIDAYISNRNFLINPIHQLSSYTDIYNFNYMKLKSDNKIYTIEQIEAIKFIKNIEPDKNKIQVYGDILQMLWASDIGKITETDDVIKLQSPVELDVKGWLENEKKQYYICFNVNDKIDLNSTDYNVIYKDKNVLILDKN